MQKKKTKFTFNSPFTIYHSLFTGTKAQTAMELAVFGVVLIFVLAAIVRQALNAGYMQNQNYRAMRMAMAMSYKYSTGLTGTADTDNGAASHRNAGILLVEDRLSADSSKIGPIDRTPYISGANATYSRNLFMPIDVGLDEDLPVYDIFINGQHFPFRTAAFKKVRLAKRCSTNGAPDDTCKADGLLTDVQISTWCHGDCTADSIQFYPATNLTNPLQRMLCSADCDSTFCRNAGDCGPGSTKSYLVTDLNDPTLDWITNCVRVDNIVTTLCSSACDGVQCADPGDCDPGSTKTWSQIVSQNVGCARLYTVVYHYLGFQEWCDDLLPCPSASDPHVNGGLPPWINLTEDQRFDLNRNGVFGEPGLDVPDAERSQFSWQWYAVAGWDGAKRHYDSGITPTSLSGAPIVLEGSKCKNKCKTPQYTTLDADGDLKLEGIMIDSKRTDKVTGVMTEFVVMDQQDGDMDFTRGDSDLGPAPGLGRSATMHTIVRDGTYFQVDEGVLYNAEIDPKQYIRTTQKKDQEDIIERTVQLTNDTDRFCDAANNVTDPDATLTATWTLAGWNQTLPNPVKACGSCNSDPNNAVTCMEQDGDLNTPGNQPPVIFVRSRVLDKHGRKWITTTSGDEAVDMNAPKIGP